MKKKVNKLFVMCLAVGMVLMSQATAMSSLTIDVTASSAPNAYGSPSWNGYVTNALNALENGLSVNGDRSTNPTGYEAAPAQIGPGEIAVTSFNSWRGALNPSGAFANELGNRIHFGLHAKGDGISQFKLEDLTFAIHSSDKTDSLVYTGGFVGLNYSATRYGINWGTDRSKGGGDDVVYNSGNGTTLVDELVYVGVGNAWWPSSPDGEQAAMDDYYAWIASEQPIDVTGSYSILGSTGSATVTVTPIPGAVWLLGSGLLGLLGIRRRIN
jgi:hypothetical protein